MEKENSGFSRFSWALAGFCLPILLWPLALLLSPAILENPTLSHPVAMASVFWIYPFVFALAARILFKMNRRNPAKAKVALWISAVVFWGVLLAIGYFGLT
ncbi:DUF5389 family protein [Bisgaard Taxon 10/6]|uniref:DUF5389 family protein n=1 Tax=Exercitatus varius TaxID=67857 RepID=UPI00294ABB97|nr:DUF5389 family protein [Exercitatus varius]MDG2947219.1 DUF5389 family protein [Exercitatus varius]